MITLIQPPGLLIEITGTDNITIQNKIATIHYRNGTTESVKIDSNISGVKTMEYIDLLHFLQAKIFAESLPPV